MASPDLNPSAQNYWPRAFVRAVSQASIHAENPGIWARFLGCGARYRLDDRRDMIRQLIAHLTMRESEPGWRAVWSHDPYAVEAIHALLHEARTQAGLREVVPGALSAIERLGGTEDAGEPVPPGVPGHVRVIVELPRRGFSVEDLIVGTTPAPQRSGEWRVQLAEYATSCPVVDRALERLDAELRLPGDEAAPVVDFLCLAASSNAIGTAMRPEDGRSLDIGLLVAALSHRFGWRMCTDRTVMTGMLHLDGPLDVLGRVVPVSHIREKLDAVVRWLETLPRLHTGLPRCEVFLPSGNAAEASPGIARIEALGGRVHIVSTIEAVFAALPLMARPPTTVPPGPADWALLTMAFGLWAERLFVGEFMTDPVTRVMHEPLHYGAISVVPALVPTVAMFLMQRSMPGSQFESGVRRAAVLTLILGGAAHIMFLVQYLLGGLDLPEQTAALFRSARMTRIGCVYKDVAISYPIVIGALGVHPLRSQRESSLARQQRRLGHVLNDQWKCLRRAAVEVPAWDQVVRWGMIVTGSLMVVAFGADFVEAWERRNVVLVGHISYQIAWPLLMGAIVAVKLARGTRGEPG